MDKHTRRDFIVGTSSLIAVGLLAPPWLSSILRAQARAEAGGATGSVAGKAFVVCQLSGGNDGLNTVIPYTSHDYYKLRPGLAIPEQNVLPISDSLGFHPSMKPLLPLYQQGKLAVVNGVGYPNPNRSHFASMRIWQRADEDEQQPYGWLGRYLDSTRRGQSPNPVLAIGLGRERSAALVGARGSVPTLASLDDVQGMLGDRDSEQSLRAIQGMDNPGSAGLQHVRESTEVALDALDTLSGLLGNYTPQQPYEDDTFGNGFRQIAQLIAVSPGTQVIYFSAGGFDTHAQQAPQHEELLRQFSGALASFMQELQDIGAAERTTVMIFSEFGRRVAENGSEGTDHGAAAPMFVAGGGIRGGLYGDYPSLTDLADGDLKHNIDFRQVYATVLTDWMGTDAASLLGADYGKLDVFS
jgi:uncharacterized protein (DUF1501 family)